MRTFSNNKPKKTTLRILLTPFLVTSVAAVLSLGLSYCSSQSKSKIDMSQEPNLEVPVNLQYIPPTKNTDFRTGETTGLALQDEGLELVSSGTALKVYIDGCASGYSVGTAGAPVAITATVKLYNGDFTCLVKLASFTLGSTVYNATGTGATNFTAWTAGSVATFSDNAGSAAANQIKVFINTQVSSPLTTSSTVVYNFTDIAAGSTASVSQANVSTAVPLSATGAQAPNYSVSSSRYLSTTSGGVGNMSFTLECGSNVTGTTPDFTCPNTDGSGDNQALHIRYNLVPDTYSTCKTIPVTLTVGNANAIFATAPSGTTTRTISASTLSATSGGGLTSTGSGQIGVGGSDNYTNVSPHGGFDTPLLPTGVNPIYGSGATGGLADASYANGYQNLNEILIIERKNTAGDVRSYLYFCVSISNLTQS